MDNDYSKNLWRLARPSTANGYKGAFPNGFIKAVKSRWWGENRCWLFCGQFKDEGQTTVDINPKVSPSTLADCEHLPFENESFDFVCADPPYSEEEAMRLYKLPYCSVVNVLNEMARVCKTGGHILFLHRLVPSAHPKMAKDEHFQRMGPPTVVAIYTLGGMSNIRALTVWRKEATKEEAARLRASEGKKEG